MDFGSTFLAAVGIGLLIFLHELGHFLAARLAGVRVEVFSLGFGQRLLGFDWRGTDFRLSLVPFGGYVMVAGQDPSDRRYPRDESLWAKSAGQRALFWSGGVLMNAVFALVVFPLVFHAGVKFAAPVVGRVEQGTAAWEGGLQRGDRIAAIGGKALYSFDNLMVEVALSGGRPTQLQVVGPDGGERVVTVLPQYDPEAGLYELGITPNLDPKPPVLRVEKGGAAEAAGLRDGDQVRAVDGQDGWLGLPYDTMRPGVPVAFDVVRDGMPVRVMVSPRPSVEDVPYRLGVEPLPRIVKGIRPGSGLIERLDLRRGDVLLAVDGKPFLGDLEAAKAGPARMRWLVRRGAENLALEQDATPAERQQLVEHLALASDQTCTLVRPTAGSPAEAAGLVAGDRIVAVGETRLEVWSDLFEAVKAAPEAPLNLHVQRVAATPPEDALAQAGAATWAVTVKPAQMPIVDLGFAEYPIAHLQHEVKAATFGEAVRLGVVCSLDLVKQLYVTLKRLVTGDVAAKNLSGIIRISQVSYQAAQRGPSWFWYFLALLSVNLAFVNLLPVPVLDGGHLLFLLIEKVKGSPVSTKVLGYSQVVGLVFVLLLVLFVTYNDILRLL